MRKVYLPLWTAERPGPDVGLERISSVINQKSSSERLSKKRKNRYRCYRARIQSTFDAVIF